MNLFDERRRPIYAALNTDADNTYYGDANIYNIPKNRDTRLHLFMKIPGDSNLHTLPGSHGVVKEPRPNILGLQLKQNIQLVMQYVKG